MAEPFAAPSDLADGWRPLTTSEQTLAQTLLGRASRRIRSRFPSIDADILSGAIDAEDALAVTVDMVKRAMLAPADGSTSEGAGPFSRSFANPTGNLYFTAEELRSLAPRRPRARSIRLTGY